MAIPSSYVCHSIDDAWTAVHNNRRIKTTEMLLKIFIHICYPYLAFKLYLLNPPQAVS